MIDAVAMPDPGCELLRSLHVPGAPLVLPNAWDVPSARAVVAAGFPVVATSSAAVAESLGFEDHQRAPAGEMFAAAARIASAVEAPVTVDAEAGYGLSPEDLVESLEAAGAAGCNLEDTDHTGGQLTDVEGHAAWLASVRRAADDRGFGLVINARVDVFLLDRSSPPAALMDGAVDRARAYAAAGADCVYPIFLAEDAAIGRFVEAVGVPVNILALPNAPSRAALAELGVARISYGVLVHRRTMQALAEILAAVAAGTD
jgi:2-methylisocitrate lyase-like PEP mutase family enzyme